jgi:hypothetical protein
VVAQVLFKGKWYTEEEIDGHEAAAHKVSLPLSLPICADQFAETGECLSKFGTRNPKPESFSL